MIMIGKGHGLYPCLYNQARVERSNLRSLGAHGMAHMILSILFSLVIILSNVVLILGTMHTLLNSNLLDNFYDVNVMLLDQFILSFY